MTLKSRYLRGGFQLVAGQVGQQSLLLVRNIIVARLLPPDQFGVALTFLTIISAFDAISELGVHFYLIRAADNHDRSVQSTMHSILFFRGAALALAIFFAAGSISNLFHAPEAKWAYQLLALVPLLKGLQHLDLKRYEKDLRFLPGVIANSVATVVGTSVVIVATYSMRNYGAIVVGYIAQSVALVICSQLFSDSKYKFSYNVVHARNIFTYGLPLVLNGIVVFLSNQGDRLLIGTILGMQELARYGVVSLLTSGTTLVAIKLTGALSFPILSRNEPGSVTHLRHFQICMAISSICAFSLMAFFAIAGQNVTTLVFGEGYAIVPLLSTWLGIQTAFKILRATQQNSMLAAANTRAVLISTLTASSGVIPATVFAISGGGLESVAMCMAGGELFSAFLGKNVTTYSSPHLKFVSMKYVWSLTIAAATFATVNALGVVPSNILTQLLIAFFLSTAWVAGLMITEQSFLAAMKDVARKILRH